MAPNSYDNLSVVIVQYWPRFINYKIGGLATKSFRASNDFFCLGKTVPINLSLFL